MEATMCKKVDGRNGVFYKAACDVSKILVNANSELANHEEPIGAGKIAAVREAMEALKPLLVLLPDDEPGSGAGGANQPAGRNIASLHEGLLLYDEHPPVFDIVLKVSAVETRHAPPLLQLLLKGAEKYRWNLLSVGRVKHLAKVCICLETVDLAVLPLLEGNGMDLAAARLIRRYGRDIRHHGKKVDGRDGVFKQAAYDVSRMLIDSYADLVKQGEPTGEGKIAAMREAMEGLKPLFVLLPDE